MIPDEVTVDKAFDSAPIIVTDYIRNGELAEAVVTIAHAHTLHVDTISLLAEVSRNMLLGLESPADVLDRLLAAGVDPMTAKSVLAELNAQVFMPLHDQVVSGKVADTDEESSEASLHPSPATPLIPAVAPSVPSSPLPTPTPMAPLSHENAGPPQPAPPSIPTAAPQPIPVTHAPLPVQVAPEPSMRTMAADMAAMKDHSTPVHSPLPSAPVPPPMPPPVESPAPIAHAVPSPASPPPQVAPRTAPPPPNLPGVPVVKKYGVDPYREPME